MASEYNNNKDWYLEFNGNVADTSIGIKEMEPYPKLFTWVGYSSYSGKYEYREVKEGGVIDMSKLYSKEDIDRLDGSSMFGRFRITCTVINEPKVI